MVFNNLLKVLVLAEELPIRQFVQRRYAHNSSLHSRIAPLRLSWTACVRLLPMNRATHSTNHRTVAQVQAKGLSFKMKLYIC